MIAQGLPLSTETSELQKLSLHFNSFFTLSFKEQIGQLRVKITFRAVEVHSAGAHLLFL